MCSGKCLVHDSAPEPPLGSISNYVPTIYVSSQTIVFFIVTKPIQYRCQIKDCEEWVKNPRSLPHESPWLARKQQFYEKTWKILETFNGKTRYRFEGDKEMNQMAPKLQRSNGWIAGKTVGNPRHLSFTYLLRLQRRRGGWRRTCSLLFR